MDKLSFGNYGSETFNDIPFSAAKGYADPQSEAEARNQLSYPLNEIQEFVNDTVPINSDNQAVQLFITEDNKLKYRTAQGGILIDVGTNDSSIPSGGTTGQVLRKRSSDDHDVEWGSADKMNPDAEAIATGDSLVFYDASASKIAKSSIQFGANENKYLRNDGTWQSVSSLGFIDTSNIIEHFENTNNSIIQKSYTATQNCYAVGGPAGSVPFVTVNNVPVSNALTVIPLKAGQTIVCALDGSRPSPYRDLTIYGIN